MEESGEVGRLGHWGTGDRVQVGDDGLGIGVDVRASGQSGEGGTGVELEEGGFEVLAVQKVDLFDIDGDFELSAGGDIRIHRFRPRLGKVLTRRLRRRRPRRSGRKCRELAVGKGGY